MADAQFLFYSCMAHREWPRSYECSLIKDPRQRDKDGAAATRGGEVIVAVPRYAAHNAVEYIQRFLVPHVDIIV